MSYQANNNPGMQGGYFQTPNDFRAQNQGYASSAMQAPGSGYGAAQRVAGGSQGLGSRRDKLLARAMSKFLIIFKLRTRAMLQACKLPDLILLPQVEE
jgi:hypothetical protein